MTETKKHENQTGFLIQNFLQTLPIMTTFEQHPSFSGFEGGGYTQFLLYGWPKNILPLSIISAYTCFAMEIQSNKTKPCVFPFKFKNRTYKGWTSIDNPNLLPWCPTKVHDNGEYISSKGQWGECFGTCETDLHGKGMKIRKSCKLF